MYASYRDVTQTRGIFSCSVERNGLLTAPPNRCAAIGPNKCLTLRTNGAYGLAWNGTIRYTDLKHLATIEVQVSAKGRIWQTRGEKHVDNRLFHKKCQKQRQKTTVDVASPKQVANFAVYDKWKSFFNYRSGSKLQLFHQ